MMFLLPFTAFASDPQSVEELPVRGGVAKTEVVETARRFRAPPTRLDVRVSFRDTAAPGSVIEGGVQIVRLGNVTLDGAVAYHAGHLLRLQGTPWRSMRTADGNLDLMAEFGWLGIGPSVGVSARFFEQDWRLIAQNVTPIAGARAHVGLIRARRWSFGISARFTADLARTEMVLDTTQIVSLSPFEAQIGGRVQFGHGKSRTRGDK